MSFQSDFRSYSLSFIQSTAFQQQIAPLLIVLLVPLITLLLFRKLSTSHLYWSAAMVLVNLGLGFPWHWTGSHPPGSIASSPGSDCERKKGRRKHSTRTRATDHVPAQNGSAKHDAVDDADSNGEGYFPGLVNISGTYCFMNSTMQAMASLCYLQPHIDAIHAKAEALDVPTPVVDALRELLQSLNTPTPYPSPIRPTALISALSNHSPKQHSATLFSSREHQDAQELFQLLAECIKSESAAVDKEGYRDRGLGGLAPSDDEWRSEVGKSPFDGLTANRRSCVECGYTEAVMHFPCDNWQLAVPRLVPSCQLEECLTDYTRLEVLTDCICRKCSMLATHKRLSQDADKLAELIKADPNASVSKKKKAKDARKLEMRVKAALEQGRIEDDVKGVKTDKVMSVTSTKQAMVARPPQVLALHINRSMHYGQYATKNTIRLVFPEILDLTPFTTSGNLSTVPSVPISTQPPRSSTPTPATYALTRTIYRLSAVVCHYGQHSFGHYVCYRRKPRPASEGAARFRPPRLGEECKGASSSSGSGSGGWLRVSDDAVRECSIADVLAEGAGAFMLYYEKVLQDRPGLSPRSSEETLKPEMKRGNNGSTVSLAASLSEWGSSSGSSSSGGLSGSGSPGAVAMMSASWTEGDKRLAPRSGGRAPLGPRVVRSVAPSRGRSLSVGPPGEVRVSNGSSSSSPSPRPTMNGSAKGKGRAVSPPARPPDHRAVSQSRQSTLAHLPTTSGLLTATRPIPPQPIEPSSSQPSSSPSPSPQPPPSVADIVP